LSQTLNFGESTGVDGGKGMKRMGEAADEEGRKGMGKGR